MIGLFAHYLGIRPWETVELSVEEFTLLADWVENHNKRAQAEGEE